MALPRLQVPVDFPRRTGRNKGKPASTLRGMDSARADAANDRPGKESGMRRQRRHAWPARLMVLPFLASFGCLGPYLNPVPAPPPEIAEPCQSLSRGCREHV